jgi:hypothetical protein
MVAQTKCPGCGAHPSARAARRRTYCSTRCRRRAERTRAWNARHASIARRAIISRPEGGATGRGRKASSNPLKLLEDKSGNRGSRVGFWLGEAPFDADLWRKVIDIEMFDRQWRPITSPDARGVRRDPASTMS